MGLEERAEVLQEENPWTGNREIVPAVCRTLTGHDPFAYGRQPCDVCRRCQLFGAGVFCSFRVCSSFQCFDFYSSKKTAEPVNKLGKGGLTAAPVVSGQELCKKVPAGHTEEKGNISEEVEVDYVSCFGGRR